LEGRKPLAYSLTDRMKHYRAPAISIAIIRAGKIDRVEAWGIVEAGGRKVDTDTLFQAASISKPVSALAAVRMSQDGNVGLDDDVYAKLKSWQVPKSEFNGSVTLRRLLSHSAGLTVDGFPGYASTAELPTVPQILDGAKPANTAAVRLNVEPGSIWRYSGGGYTVMTFATRSGTFGSPSPGYNVTYGSSNITVALIPPTRTGCSLPPWAVASGGRPTPRTPIPRGPP